ncbi:NPP1 family protein [Streptomyces sp. L7]
MNGGLNPTGSLSGRVPRRLGPPTTPTATRATSATTAGARYMYGLYFEKDQAIANSSIGGHRNDWEHVVVWVQNGTIQYVSTSNHGSFTVHAASEVRFDGTHAKIVYHKDGIGTHDFRLANAGDEPPENDKHTWQYPPLVGWNGYPAGLRDKLSAYDFRQRELRPQGRQLRGPPHLGEAFRNHVRPRRLTVPSTGHHRSQGSRDHLDPGSPRGLERGS